MQISLKYIGIFDHKSKNIIHTQGSNNSIYYFSISMFFLDITGASVYKIAVIAVSELIINILKRVLKAVIKYIMST